MTRRWHDFPNRHPRCCETHPCRKGCQDWGGRAERLAYDLDQARRQTRQVASLKQRTRRSGSTLTTRRRMTANRKVEILLIALVIVNAALAIGRFT